MSHQKHFLYFMNEDKISIKYAYISQFFIILSCNILLHSSNRRTAQSGHLRDLGVDTVFLFYEYGDSFFCHTYLQTE